MIDKQEALRRFKIIWQGELNYKLTESKEVNGYLIMGYISEIFEDYSKRFGDQNKSNGDSNFNIKD